VLTGATTTDGGRLARCSGDAIRDVPRVGRCAVATPCATRRRANEFSTCASVEAGDL